MSPCAYCVVYMHRCWCLFVCSIGQYPAPPTTNPTDAVADQAESLTRESAQRFYSNMVLLYLVIVFLHIKSNFFELSHVWKSLNFSRWMDCFYSALVLLWWQGELFLLNLGYCTVSVCKVLSFYLFTQMDANERSFFMHSSHAMVKFYG